MSTIDITNLAIANEKETSELLFNINAGLVEGVYTMRKYGANLDVDVGEAQYIRDFGTAIYPYVDENKVVYAISTNALDTGMIAVTGLVEVGDKWIDKTVIVTLNGTTPVSCGEFIRVFRIRHYNGIHPTGDVYVSEDAVGQPAVDDTWAICRQEIGSTMMAVYTVPSDYTAFIASFYGSVGKGKDANIRLDARLDNTPDFVGYGSVGLYQSTIQLDMSYMAIPAKTDIALRGETENNGTEIRASLVMILVPNNYLKL